MVYYGREYEEEKSKREPGNELKPQQWLLDLFWNSLRKNAQSNPGEKGWACGKEGHLKRDCPQASKLPLTPSPVCKGPYWRRDCPLRCRPQVLDSQDNWDWRCPGVPTQTPILMTPEEPQVLITVGDQSLNFLLKLGQLSLCSLEPLVCFPPDPQPRNGASEWAKCYYFSHPLSCKWSSGCFLMSFWLCQNLPHPFWGGIYWARSRPLFS